MNDEIKLKYGNNNKLKEMNTSNNDKKYKFQKIFIFPKPGEWISYKNKIKFLIKDSGFMFYKCRRLKKIDLSNFNIINITNMERMFCYCEIGIKFVKY